MNIGEMVRLMVDRREPRTPYGGIGGLTPTEEAELSDLINGPHTICECGVDGCCSPLPKNPDRGPGR